MLNSILLVTTSLADGATRWSNAFGDQTQQTGNTSVTPNDPSSLTLALIGIGTVACYLAVKRWPRSRGTAETGRPSEQAVFRESIAGSEERPSRGAA